MDLVETLRGAVERVTFADPESGYGVIRLTVKGKLDLVTVVGDLADVNPGETVELQGEWMRHPQYGYQFKAQSYRTVLPATIEGITKYLGSGLIKGIGPVMAERIVRRFGLDTLDVIEQTPDQLLQVLGIGRKRVTLIRAAWAEQKQIREVMVFLQGHGVRPSWAVKIFKAFGDQAIQVIQQDPYRLAREINGIGFKTADQIARQLGLPPDSPQRVAAGVAYMLGEMADQGHVYAPQEELVQAAAEMLDVPADLARSSLETLEQQAQIHRETLQYPLAESTSNAIREEQAVYLTPFYYGEIGVVGRLQRMLEHPGSRISSAQHLMWDVILTDSAQGLPLSDQQREAVRTTLTQRITVLTGGPGTGKTTTVRTVLDVLDCLKCRYALASPTGRAAKRLTETTGRPAQTIHRLLGFVPGEGFKHNENNPLDIDMLIVDEVSMLDLLLTNHLLKAIHPATHLLLVGDVDQLPSVGAGSVLHDMIASGQVPVVRLDAIFRQAADSLIVANAHRINQGQMPLFSDTAADFFLFVQDDPDQAADLIGDIVQHRIPRRFGYDPMTDIQVLCPMYRGAVGVDNLNDRLQAALNPPAASKAERRLSGRSFREGDRVIQLRNNYDLDMYNGDMGQIAAIDVTNQLLRIRMDDRIIDYDWSCADELSLAYAISIHKAQGSEYPAVVIPVMTSHYMLLTRPVLYTAITRAKKLVVLVGTRKAIAIAVRNNKVQERHTALDIRLKLRPDHDTEPPPRVE